MQVIYSAENANDFANKLAPRLAEESGGNSISNSVALSVKLIEHRRFRTDKKIFGISGDGPRNVKRASESRPQ